MKWVTALRSVLALESSTTARFAQLATLTQDGRPSVRTIVVRQVLNNGAIQMTTDSRSAKVAGLRRCSWGELCWYFYVRDLHIGSCTNNNTSTNLKTL